MPNILFLEYSFGEQLSRKAMNFTNPLSLLHRLLIYSYSPVATVDVSGAASAQTTLALATQPLLSILTTREFGRNLVVNLHCVAHANFQQPLGLPLWWWLSVCEDAFAVVAELSSLSPSGELLRAPARDGWRTRGAECE